MTTGQWVMVAFGLGGFAAGFIGAWCARGVYEKGWQPTRCADCGSPAFHRDPTPKGGAS